MGESLLTLGWSILVVFFAAVIFVNAIEYCGYRFKLGSSFVGAILAPLFTSFPELTVFLVAVFAVGGSVGAEIGMGTLFGQPFMASSLAYGLVGIAVLVGFLLKKRSSGVLHVDRSLAIPYVFITLLFPLTLVPAVIDFPGIKYVFGGIFLGAFLLYIWMMFRKKSAELIEECAESYLFRFGGKILRSRVLAALLQLGIAALALYFGSHSMVGAVNDIASGAGLSALGLALIIVPAATAIPETASALIWGYRGKDTLSLGSLVGEKILYSTFYPALGLFLIPWNFDRHVLFSVIATTIISFILLIYILKGKMPWYGLCLGLIFFVTYAVLIFAYQF